MRTIEEVLAELRTLAAQAQQGVDVSQRRAEVERELASLGFTAGQPQPVAPAPAPAPTPTPAPVATLGAPQPQPVPGLTPAGWPAPMMLGAPQPAPVPALAGVGAPQTPQPGGGGTAFPVAAPATLSASEQEELARLRAAAQEQQMRAFAEQFAGYVEQSAQQHQTRQAQAMAAMVQQALGARGLVPANGQDPVLQAAVIEALKNVRGGSRFIGPNGQPDAASHLAAGGSFDANGQPVAGGGMVLGSGIQVAQPGGAVVGEDQALKELEDSKSLGRLMAVVARAHKAPWMLQGHEARFLRKISEKAMAQGTPSAGGLLVPEQWMPDILELIRVNAVVRRARPRIVPFNKTMNQTSVSTGSTAYYTQENARIPVSEMTFAEAPILSPHYLTALVPVSNYLLDNAPGVDALVRDDMQAALATREDLAFLQGAGLAGEPLGLRNLPGIILNPIAPGTNGFVPTLPDFRRIKGRTRLVGSQNPRWTWFFHPALLTYLETLTDSTGRFLVDSNILTINADGVSGTFDGLPFFASYQIPTALTLGTSNNATYILLIDMNDTILGESVDLQIDVSTEATYSPDGGTTHVSAFQQNQTVFRVIMGHDINHRRPATGVIDQEGVLV